MTRAVIPLFADEKGATIVEFAFVVPIMLLMLMGFGEIAYQGLLQSVLSGEVQRAARNSTIEGAGVEVATIDGKVAQAVKLLNKGATYASTRKSYHSYTDANKPEYFIDKNNDGIYNVATECFYDTNSNKKYDTDPGTTEGVGQESDVVIYTGTVKYRRIFPIWNSPLWNKVGLNNDVTLTSTTMLKNQPVQGFVNYSPKKICP